MKSVDSYIKIGIAVLAYTSPWLAFSGIVLALIACVVVTAIEHGLFTGRFISVGSAEAQPASRSEVQESSFGSQPSHVRLET